MTPRRGRRTPHLVIGFVLALLLSACGASSDDEGHQAHQGQDGATAEAAPETAPSPDEAHSSHGAAAVPVRHRPLREGERRVTVRMPQTYTPSPPTGTGTDDYRCFLLDPKLAEDQFVTGFNVLPDNPEVVHHVILFRVPSEGVAAAEQLDKDVPGPGWTCFGTSGMGGAGAELDDAPWLGAWAPGGREQVYGKGLGEELGQGSRIIMQVHYNLLAGSSPDRSAAELRLASASDDITPLETKLLPAPVELPCRPQHADGPLCDRADSLADVKKRFGAGPGSTADALHVLCGGEPPGPVQTCTRTVQQPETVRGVAGHMHLLGRSIKVEVNPGTPRARTILDIPVWDFDNQGSRPVKGARLMPQDTIKVTCRHSQELRDRLPSFEGQPDKYVVWGEGTTDEMCLAILLVTRP